MFHRSVCIRLAAVLLAASVARSSALPLDERPRPEPAFLTYAAEGAGGYLGVTLGFAAGLLVANSTNGDWGTTLVAVGLPAAVFGCASGTCRLGRALGQDGKFPPTLGYTAGAFTVGGGLLWAGGRNYDSGIGRAVAYAGGGIAILAPVVATIGYNRSRPRDSYGGQLVPGAVGLTAVKDAEGIVHPALNVRPLAFRL